MTAGRRKKLEKIEVRIDDIAGELVGLMAVEYDAGGRDREAARYLDIARTDLRYALEMVRKAEGRRDD